MILKVKCSWCGLDMGRKECVCTDRRFGDTTHGICPECKKRLEAEIETIKSAVRNNNQN